MTPFHSTDHEPLLEALLFDPSGPDAEAHRRILGECPECCSKLKDLEILLGDLDTAGSFERSIIRDAHEVGESWLDGRLDFTREVRKPRLLLGRGGAVLALAAAAMIFIVLRFGSDGPQNEPDAPIYLGTEATVGMQPSGTVDEYGRVFAWELELPRNGSFSLSVYPASSKTDLEFPPALATQSNLTANEWSWHADETAGWPEDIRWVIQAIEASGLPGASLEALASRSSR